jgi:uncharacterized protein YgiM (DUF1202 family)
MNMKKITTIIALLFFTFHVIGQTYKYVNKEAVNIRESAGKQYEVVGQVTQGEKVTVISESKSWTQIVTTSGVKGYVASNFLTTNIETEQKEKKEKNLWGKILFVLIIFGIGYIKVKKFFTDLFGGSSSSSSSQRNTQIKTKEVRRKSSNSAVYRFRINGSGSAGGFYYADGMNVEVAVTGLGAGGSPFNSIVEKLFVQEIARKYNVEPRLHSGIKMLFKRDSLDVEIM